MATKQIAILQSEKQCICYFLRLGIDSKIKNKNHKKKKKKLQQKKKECSEIDNFMIFILFDFDKLRLW